MFKPFKDFDYENILNLIFEIKFCHIPGIIVLIKFHFDKTSKALLAQ